jgi:hypothetical protein
MKQMVAGISIVLVAIGIVAAASALQNPYPMDGYVTDNAGATVSGATVTFTNQNTGEAIYDDTLYLVQLSPSQTRTRVKRSTMTPRHLVGTRTTRETSHLATMMGM